MRAWMNGAMLVALTVGAWSHVCAAEATAAPRYTVFVEVRSPAITLSGDR